MRTTRRDANGRETRADEAAALGKVVFEACAVVGRGSNDDDDEDVWDVERLSTRSRGDWGAYVVVAGADEARARGLDVTGGVGRGD